MPFYESPRIFYQACQQVFIPGFLITAIACLIATLMLYKCWSLWLCFLMSMQRLNRGYVIQEWPMEMSEQNVI